LEGPPQVAFQATYVYRFISACIGNVILSLFMECILLLAFAVFIPLLLCDAKKVYDVYLLSSECQNHGGARVVSCRV